ERCQIGKQPREEDEFLSIFLRIGKQNRTRVDCAFRVLQPVSECAHPRVVFLARQLYDVIAATIRNDLEHAVLVDKHASGFTKDLDEEIPSQPMGIAATVLERLRRLEERQ